MLVVDIKSHLVANETMGFFVFYFMNKPIAKVEVVGVVTKIVRRAKSMIFYIDDGTELLRCTQYINQDETVMSSSIVVGDVVSVKGLVAMAETNDDDYGFCLRVSLIEAVHDPHCEVHHWLTVVQNNKAEVVASIAALGDIAPG